MEEKIKTIAFDLGGVVFADGRKVAMESLFKSYGYDKELVMRLFTSPECINLRKGLINDEKFWSWAQNKLPQGYDAQIIKKTWYEGYLLDNDIFSLVKKLKDKNKYKLFVFSGSIKSRVEYLDNKYHFRKYFDKEIYSYDYCFSKTDKNCVKILIKETKNKPEEIAYIDDGEGIIKFAKEKFGINGIIYKTGEIKELEEGLKNLGVQW